MRLKTKKRQVATELGVFQYVKDEIGSLSISFNAMLDWLDSSFTQQKGLLLTLPMS